MSSEVFVPENKSIRKIFGDTDAFYEVPDYQRPYKWDNERVEQLWDDLYSSFLSWKDEKESAEAYFLGSIILIKNGDHFDIVDGQQRLTTLTIFFSVIRDLFPNLNNKTHKVLQNSIKDLVGEKSRIRFTTSIDNQNEFEQHIINKVVFPVKFTQADKKKYPYLNTALLFKDFLSNMTVEEVDSFVNYILDHVQIITIKCFKPSFAIKLFQVLNARGLDLSASDLIKSYLMNQLPDNQRQQFINDWRKVEELAKSLKSDLDTLLNYYLYHLIGSNPKQSLYDELVLALQDRNANEVIYEMRLFIESYRDIINLNNKSIYSLKYLRHELYWKSILASAKFNKREDINELATILRNFYYAHWVSGYSSTKIKQASFTVLQMINKDKSNLLVIKAYLSKIQIENNVFFRIKRAFTENCYHERWLKPLLASVEYAQTDHVSNFIELNSEVHTEHVLPIKFFKFEYWKNLYSQVEANLLLNSLPNLTLLSGKKNIDASNSPFPEKIDIYNGKGNQGLTAYRITQWIRDKYNSGNTDWNKNLMQARYEWIVNEINNEFQWNIEILELNEILNQSPTGESYQAEENDFNIEIEKEESRLNFNQECILNLARISKDEFERISRDTYRNKNNNSITLCKVSKEYKKSNPGYWYGFHLDDKAEIEKKPDLNNLLLGCGSVNQMLLIPGRTILDYLNKMNQTINQKSEYWHIHIEKHNEKFILKLKEGEKVDISKYIVS